MREPAIYGAANNGEELPWRSGYCDGKRLTRTDGASRECDGRLALGNPRQDCDNEHRANESSDPVVPLESARGCLW